MKNCYPVTRVGDRVPVVSQEYKPDRHLGCDIMFRRLLTDPPDAEDGPRGTKGYHVPEGVKVVACASGVVVYAKWSTNGYRVRLRHPSGFDTIYLHLETMGPSLKPGVDVPCGTVLGLMGGDPSSADPRHTVHLHFEMRRRAAPGEKGDQYGMVAINPEPYLDRWDAVEG